jgi:hypothetical protein
VREQMALLSRPVGSGKFAAFTHWTCLRFLFKLVCCGNKVCCELLFLLYNGLGCLTLRVGVSVPKSWAFLFVIEEGVVSRMNGREGGRKEGRVIGRLKYRSVSIASETKRGMSRIML